MDRIYFILSINSFIVLLDSTIKIAKNDKILNNEQNLNQNEISLLSSFGISGVFFLIEITISIYIKKYILLIMLILIVIILCVYLIKHDNLLKWKIFKNNHIIFDILMLMKPLILFIFIKSIKM